MTDSDLPGVVNPQRLVWELSEQLPNNAIVAADSGSSANWYARDLRFRGDVRGSLSGTLATMGPGVPVCDRRQVRASGPTGHRPRRRRRHADERHGRTPNGRAVLEGVVGSSAHRGGPPQQRSEPGHLGDAGHGGRPEVRRVAVPARLFLCRRSRRPSVYTPSRSPNPDQIADAWRQALAADRPTVLDVHTDPNVPPIPPHATFDQMKSAGLAMLHGDEDARAVVTTGVKQKMQEFLPGRKDQ